MLRDFPAKISASVYQLGNHLFRTYLVCGESYALIESGVTGSATLISSQIAQLGIDPKKLKYLVVLHAHHDHACGVPVLKQAFPQLQVLASASAAKLLAKEKVVQGFYHEDRPINEKLFQNGLASRLVGPEELPATIKVDKVVADGEVIDLGQGCTLQFKLVPGHSPCSMTVYFPRERVLFPTDCAGYPLARNFVWSVYFYDYAAYLQGLQNILALPVEILAGPHELVLIGADNVSSHLRLSYESLLRQHQGIIEAYNGGKTPEEISTDMYNQIFWGGLTFYTVATIKGCTDLLVRRSLETIGVNWESV